MTERLVKVGKLGGILREVIVRTDDTVKEVFQAGGITGVRKAKASLNANGSNPRDVSLEAKANGYKVIFAVPAVNGGC